MTHDSDVVHFDELVTLALADVATAGAPAPSPELRQRVLSAISEPSIPAGFAFRFERDADWLPHPVPGIRMKVLALNRAGGYATLLLDVAPGARFPAHSHFGPEECYVISGSLYTCDRCLRAGDFIHAEGGTEHGELWTDEGCRVLLVVPPEDYMPDPIATR
jgi:anti-sigma factor ChrR (cupin superfamily)